MHLYAHDDQEAPVLAHRASKGTVYRCIECGTPVRVKQGSYRIPHFYHIYPKRKCRQNGKSHRHLQLQLSIERQLPVGEAVLEKRFPEINRIADVVWEKEKIIFEVQCSPMTSQEVKERMRDYQSVGYQVVWILDELRFNKYRITPVEHVLKRGEFYFADMKCKIYDQFRMIQKGLCVKKLLPLTVDISQLHRKDQTFYFSGDITDRCLQSPHYENLIEETKDRYREKIPSYNPLKAIFSLYSLFFRFFLERATR